MSPREVVDPEVDDDGWESHPSYGWVYVNRATGGPASLFDSEILHHQFVVLHVGRARRKRDLNRDWLMEDGLTPIVEIRMSLAQWGALVSSFGSSGVPATLSFLDGDHVPEAPHSPRTEVSIREVEGATEKLLAQVAAATGALREAWDRKAGRREIADLLRTLEIRLGNAKANARYAAETFTEHVEEVVTKARADVEAMVATAAAHQLDVGDVRAALGIGDPDPEATP